MKKYYAYLVAYFHEKGNGNIQIYRKKKIKTLEDLNDVRNFIKDEEGFESVVIFNVLYFGVVRR